MRAYNIDWWLEFDFYKYATQNAGNLLTKGEYKGYNTRICPIHTMVMQICALLIVDYGAD